MNEGARRVGTVTLVVVIVALIISLVALLLSGRLESTAELDASRLAWRAP